MPTTEEQLGSLHDDYSNFPVVNSCTVRVDTFRHFVADSIKAFENAPLFRGTIDHSNIHLPTADGNPTIGYGFDLRTAGTPLQVHNLLVWALGGNLTQTQLDGVALVDAYRAADGNPTLQAQYRLILAGQAGTQAERAAISSISLSQAQASNALDALTFGNADAGITGNAAKMNDVRRLARTYWNISEDFPESRELASLVIMHYRGDVTGFPDIFTDSSAYPTDGVRRAEFWWRITSKIDRPNTPDGVDARLVLNAKLFGPCVASGDPQATLEGMSYLFRTYYSNVYSASSIYSSRVRESFNNALVTGREIINLFWGDQTIEDVPLKFDPMKFDIVQLAKGQENLSPISTAVSKNQLADLMVGSDDRNSLSGGDGNDALYGQGGNDTLSGDGGDDHLWGGTGNDRLLGGQGNDVLVGNEGVDTMLGGQGDDAYVVDNASDIVVELNNEGYDQVFSSTNYSIEKADAVEELTLIGDSDINATGNAGNNLIIGNTGNNYLKGNEGQDTLAGYAGNDTIEGGSELDIIYGGSGNDILKNDDESAQNSEDALIGGSGYDTYYVSSKEGIYDRDGRGQVVYHGDKLVGGSHKEGSPDNVYFSSDGKYRYVYSLGNLIINDSLYIYNYTPGQLDIKLDGGNNTASSPSAPQIKSPLPDTPISEDPLVLDLDGDGVETVGLSANISFDYNQDGIFEQTGFVAADDALLVVDLNNDGVINGGSELFGNHSLLSDGTYSEHGFQTLADYDTNKDGVVNSSDTNFGKIKLFKDINQNGRTDAGELKSLADFNISQLSSIYTHAGYFDSAGNWRSDKGSYEKTDGQRLEMSEVWFSENSQAFSEQILPTSDFINGLPDIDGHGNVHSLHQAMVRDESGGLAALVDRFVHSDDFSERKSLVEDILFKWTNQGSDVISTPGSSLDGRVLGVLDLYFGSAVPSRINSSFFYQSLFDTLVADTYYNLAAQSNLKDALAAVTWNDNGGGTWTGNFDKAIDQVLIAAGSNPAMAESKFQEFLYCVDALDGSLNNNIENLSDSFIKFATGQDITGYNQDIIDLAYKYLFKGYSYSGSAQNDSIICKSPARIDDLVLVNAGAGDDYIKGDYQGSQPDSIFLAGAGNDTIDGFNFGDDSVFGGDGDDRVINTYGKDLLSGGDGNDYIGDVTLNWSKDSEDVLDDVIEGGKGNDTLAGGGGHDSYVYNEGDGYDQIVDISGKNTIEFTDIDRSKLEFRLVKDQSDQSLVISLGNEDIISYKLDIDDLNYTDDIVKSLPAIVFADGVSLGAAQLLQILMPATNNNDKIFSLPDTGVVNGLSGRDLLIGSSGNDTLLGGDGNDQLHGDLGDDLLVGGNDSDQIYDVGGTNIIEGGAGDDYIDVGEGSNFVNAGDGNDSVSLSYSSGSVNAGSGDDNITLFNSNVTIDAGSGEDKVVCTGGNVSAVFKAGNGYDIFTKIDTLILDSSMSPDNIVFYRGGFQGDQNDLYLVSKTDPNDVAVLNDYFTSSPVDILYDNAPIAQQGVTPSSGKFDDFYLIDPVSVFGRYSVNDNTHAEWLQFSGTSGDDRFGSGLGFAAVYGIVTVLTNSGVSQDYIYSGDETVVVVSEGGWGDDAFFSGGSEDRMYGGGGDDSYYLGGYFGVDKIDDNKGENNKIVFNQGIKPEDVKFSIRTSEFGYQDAIAYVPKEESLVTFDFDSIDRVEFSDGTVWSKEEIFNNISSLSENFTISSLDTLAYPIGQKEVLMGTDNSDYLIGVCLDPESVMGGAGDDHVVLLRGTDASAFGDNGNDTIEGSYFSSKLFGGQGNDLLISHGLNGSTTKIDGGLGSDTMLGGIGDDIYFVDDAADVVIDASYSTGNEVRSSVNYALTDSSNVYLLELEGSGAILGQGNSSDNSLTGNDFDNILIGLSGDDIFYGELGNDSCIGGDGNDIFYGEGGSDTYVGGAGDDRYMVADASDIVVEDANQGVDSVVATTSYTLSENIENIEIESAGSATGNSSNNIIRGSDFNNTLSGLAGNDSLIGGQGDDLLLGGDGDDTLSGGGNTDSLSGGNGDDVYLISNVNEVIFENAGEGTDTVIVGGSYTLSNNLENSTLQLATANSGLIGNTLNNVLTGDSYSNSISGGDGNDTVYGGSGADILSGGTGNDRLFGDGGPDSVSGGSGNDTLTGGSENDTLAGGTGDDVYDLVGGYPSIVENAGEGIDLVISSGSCTLTNQNIERLTLIGDEVASGTGNTLANVLRGNDQDNHLYGMEGNDTIIAAGGNDWLYGGSGIDSLIGGKGSDIYEVSDVGDVVVENYNEGIDLVNSSISYVLSSNVENLTLTNSGNVNGTGNSLNNILIGNNYANQLVGAAGNDTLQGVYGADTLIGGVGDDTYIVGNAHPLIVEQAGEGTDWIVTTDSYVLPDNVENLTLVDNFHANGTGNALNNFIMANQGSNILIGNAGNDTLDGGTWGRDTLIGGTGNDVYVIDHTIGLLTEQAGEGTDTVYASVSYVLDANVENLVLSGSEVINGTGNSLSNMLLGNSANNYLSAGSGNDSLIGGAGNDTLEGGAGIDTISGGVGNDTYFVDSLADIIVESVAEDSDSVVSSVDFALAENFENLSLSGTAISGGGNSADNYIRGNSANNILESGMGSDTLDGGSGSDTMSGGLGDDFYFVSATTDVVNENVGEGLDTVESTVSLSLGGNTENLYLLGTGNINATGNLSNNFLIGNAGNNRIVGADGNDTLDGGVGIDTLTGGLGDDTYFVDSVSEVVVENIAEGSDLVNSLVTITLSSNVENLQLIGSGGIDGTGNALNNFIAGNRAANNLNGLDGNDTLIGAAGNDTLNGGTGSDIMKGGLDNDVYVVDDNSDAVVELFAEGVDLVASSISYQLTNNVENLTLTGSGQVNGTGNASDNVITGNAANNVLAGGIGNDTMLGALGADTLIGGVGDDVYVIDSVNDVISEFAGQGADLATSSITFALVTNVENLTLTGVSAIDGTGNSSNNVLLGNVAANKLSAGSGNDTLDGGAGVDTLLGGTGDDCYIINEVSDVATEYTGAGNDGVFSSISYTLGSNLENLYLVGTNTISGTGNTLNNIIVGNAANNALSGGSGNDTLDGGAGNDSLAGGVGDDTYLIESTADVISENASSGVDTVISAFSYSLGDNLENISLIGSDAVSGTGNALNNYLSGNSGNNGLVGGAGSDTLDGGFGNDTLVGGVGDDVYILNSLNSLVSENANEGTDTIHSSISMQMSENIENIVLDGVDGIGATGNSLDNVLTGNSGNNRLNGGDGNDLLVGGAGNDTMSGDAGTDTLSGDSGDDVYIINDTGETVVELPSEGIDSVYSSIDCTLAENVENLNLTGLNAIRGTGNGLGNIIFGSSAANALAGGEGNDSLSGASGFDTLDGGAGLDTLLGGTGDDTYYVDNAGDLIIEGIDEGTDLVYSSVGIALSSNVENVALTGALSVNASGNGLNNALTGNSGENILNGGEGNDTINGNGGVDTLVGGVGDDIYFVNSASDKLVENLGEGVDSAISYVSFTLSSNVDNLTLVGAAAINGTGNLLNNSLVGNELNNAIAGDAGDDTIMGGLGNDTLNGGLGKDVLKGGAGDDVYYVDDSGDSVTEFSGQGTDVVCSSVSRTLGDNVENLILTGAGSIRGTGNSLNNIVSGNDGNNSLFGLDGSDSILGGGGNDTLDGGAGNDTMNGGVGNDTYYVNSYNDFVTELLNEGIDVVSSTSNYAMQDNIENLILTGTDSLSGTGNSLDNVLTGNTGNNRLTGSFGNDTLDGGAGNDTLIGGVGDDTYLIDTLSDVITEYGGSGTDVVISGIDYTLGSSIENLRLSGTTAINGVGNTLNNWLIGNGANNVLFGDVGNDTLDGGVGSDSLSGGGGDDIFIVNTASDVVSELSNQGIDTVISTASFVLGENIENLIQSGTSAISAVGNSLNNFLTGNGANNSLTGGIGNDTLDGALGNDSLVGGTGDDVYFVENSSDVIVENSGEGIDSVFSTSSYQLGSYIENITLAGANAINGTGNDLSNLLTGNSSNNQLIGGAGNDSLDGGAGNDTLIGGVGDDVYVVNATAIVVNENSGEGNDTIRSNISFTLTDNVESLVLVGSDQLNGTGNALNNTLFGNSANNILTGAAGNDTLDGGVGNDTLVGGVGDDTYLIDTLSDVITENSGSGSDTVICSVDYTLGSNIENLSLSGASALNGSGNSLNNILIGNSAGNVLVGNAGNDTLDGGAGGDTMSGGLGDDFYVVNSSLDVVNESVNEGNDTVVTSVYLVLGDNLENLTLSGSSALNSAGNILDNYIVGNIGANKLTGDAGNDTLLGGGGVDTLIGGAGDDQYFIDSSDDVVTEYYNSGADQVNSNISYTLGSYVENLTLTGAGNVAGTGNTLNNVLTGNNANNLLTGDSGNDTLAGGAGVDTLVGGVGNDNYIFGLGSGSDSIVETDATAGNTDIVSLLGGVSKDQLWFRKVNGLDLEVSIIGTTDKLTIGGWYNGQQAHVEQFKTSEGSTLLDSSVQNLVNAMASLAPPALGETTLSPTYQNTLSGVIAASWT